MVYYWTYRDLPHCGFWNGMKWGISPEYMAIVPILRGISIYIYNYMIHQKDLGYCTLCFTQTNGNGWKSRNCTRYRVWYWGNLVDGLLCGLVQAWSRSEYTQLMDMLIEFLMVLCCCGPVSFFVEDLFRPLLPWFIDMGWLHSQHISAIFYCFLQYLPHDESTDKFWFFPDRLDDKVLYVMRTCTNHLWRGNVAGTRRLSLFGCSAWCTCLHGPILARSPVELHAVCQHRHAIALLTSNLRNPSPWYWTRWSTRIVRAQICCFIPYIHHGWMVMINMNEGRDRNTASSTQNPVQRAKWESKMEQAGVWESTMEQAGVTLLHADDLKLPGNSALQILRADHVANAANGVAFMDTTWLPPKLEVQRGHYLLLLLPGYLGSDLGSVLAEAGPDMIGKAFETTLSLRRTHIPSVSLFSIKG